ncbi:MAG: T9SS type A sorting domain-containing protein [Ignavibacteriales bacterium]|nr:T9SS type A sorting domain-containing protein [Ignavibacteriales bacterium]MCF8304968.1 T9SS type A sorting domain-containing protein [Ignavibacteriales bacterium]MCF8314657.1 T9SS type A sorting domain-containing protein [Ignavibacteriales bacterium]MCF8436306.1 T9SS type A sorting domain-containing protein [Ignavibacteriales bacterium]
MKKYLLVNLLVFSNLFAGWGLFDAGRSDLTINFNGTGTNYTIWNSGVGTFNTANLGEFTLNTQTLAISDWAVYTWKNGAGDVTNADLYYTIYENGNRPGTPVFTMIDGGWLADLGGGDQRWGKSSSTSIDITGLTNGKTYKLEIYIKVDGTESAVPSSIYDNNSGSNYIATFTTNSTFPVELTSFAAQAKAGFVQLNWATATEVNNYGFDVQRSAGNGWEKIAFIEGNGNSNSPKSYSFTDKNVLSGTYSYRLKQIDTDGQFEYSDVVAVEINNLPSVYSLDQNYPNPFNPTTNIKFGLPKDAFVSLKVFNILGQEVKTLLAGFKPAGEYVIPFDASDLTSGLYLYKLETEGFSSVRKMLLTK